MEKIKKVFCEIYFRIRYLAVALRSANDYHLMDDVIYKDKRYFINNGTSAPIWDLCECEKNYPRDCPRVHQDEFRKELSWWNIKNSVGAIYGWYMRNWHGINMRNAMVDNNYSIFKC